MGKNEGKNTFLSGVLILTVANLITKIIGLVFKIPLTNMLGNEGMMKNLRSCGKIYYLQYKYD